MKKELINCKYAVCPMCDCDQFFVITFDVDNRLGKYNTQLVCRHCGYEVPIELVEFKA